jgi:hypothetical protein
MPGTYDKRHPGANQRQIIRHYIPCSINQFALDNVPHYSGFSQIWSDITFG